LFKLDDRSIKYRMTVLLLSVSESASMYNLFLCDIFILLH
jgi:hypothetical protein